MSYKVPSSLRRFIDQELSAGRYASEDELLFAAVTMLQEMTERHSELRGHVQEAIKQSDDGLGRALDMAALKKRVVAKANINNT